MRNVRPHMRPLFTIHAGEYVVGDYIEQTFPDLDVWVPVKDRGIDLLVTGNSNLPPISLQVKLSRDYKALEAATPFQKAIRAAGWLTIDDQKLANSKADLWVIVLVSNERMLKPQFVTIPPKDLHRKLLVVHGKCKRYQFYPWITKDGLCLDGRGLMSAHKDQLVKGTIVLGERDLTPYLGQWKALENLANKS